MLNDTNNNNEENVFSSKINSLEEESQHKKSMVATSRIKISKEKKFKKE